MNSQTIVAYLEMVANSSLLVNFLMHLVAFVAIAAIFVVTDDRVRRMIFQAALSVLFLSVTINAIVYGNPFHILTFGILAATALLQLARGKEKISVSSSLTILPIILIIIP